MFGIKDVLLLSLVINVFVNGYQDDGHLDGELEVLLKRLQGRLEYEERGYELQDLFERGTMSGIEVSPEIAGLFNDMKLRKTNKWATFKIENKKMIVVDTKSGRTSGSVEEDEARFNEMKAKLTSEPRYILFDFHFILKKNGRKIQKLAFIFWCDDKNAKIGDSMIYAASKDTLKKEFTGLGVEFQANDMGDMDYETFRADVERKA